MAALEELYTLIGDGAIAARLATPSQTSPSSSSSAAAATDCLTWLYGVCLAQARDERTALFSSFDIRMPL